MSFFGPGVSHAGSYVSFLRTNDPIFNFSFQTLLQLKIFFLVCLLVSIGGVFYLKIVSRMLSSFNDLNHESKDGPHICRY